MALPATSHTYASPGNLEAALREVLLANAAVTALVGTRVAVDQFPSEITAFPRIVIVTGSKDRGRHSTGADGLCEASVQVNVFADTSQSRAQVAWAVRNALHCHPRGTIGTSTRAVDLLSCTLVRDRGDHLWTEDGGQIGTYVRVMEFQVWMLENVPTFA